MSIVPYNEETGELLYDAGYTITSPEQREAYKQYLREQEAKQNGRKYDFTNANMTHLHEVYDVLSTAQCGYLMLLQCYIDYETGIIVNPDKSPMTTNNMRQALQLQRKRSTFYDFLTACLDNGIIAEDGEAYIMNQRYHFKGAIKGAHAIKTYIAKIKRVYSEVKATDIGLIYRMLPLVHMSTNALCDNPFEKDPKKVRWLNRKELAEHIGVDPAFLGRRLPLMKFDGEYVVARIKVGSEPERYTMNPSVFYRQDKTPDDTLLAMFSVEKRKKV